MFVMFTLFMLGTIVSTQNITTLKLSDDVHHWCPKPKPCPICHACNKPKPDGSKHGEENPPDEGHDSGSSDHHKLLGSDDHHGLDTFANHERAGHTKSNLAKTSSYY
jgi:hypothetical protein